MDSDIVLPSSGGQRRSPDEGLPTSMSRAVVRWITDRWVVEVDGVLEHEGSGQIDAEFVAVECLAGRGGELLIRDVRGRQVKRIVIEAGG